MRRQNSKRGGRRKRAPIQDRVFAPRHAQQSARREARAQTEVNSFTVCKGRILWFCQDRDSAHGQSQQPARREARAQFEVNAFTADKGCGPTPTTTDLNWFADPSGRACSAKGLQALPTMTLINGSEWISTAGFPSDTPRTPRGDSTRRNSGRGG